MKLGLKNDGFKVYYQPIYSIKENSFTTAEALLRFSDTELGVVSPIELIPIAEETGLIIDIGYMVIDKVCKFIRTLEEEGIRNIAISVNISAVQLNDLEFVENFLDITDRNKIKPGKLCIEITESTFVEKFEQMRDVMWKLKEHGVKFYLDDFGTGYSNIVSIIDLPFEFIKVDKSILYKSISSEKSLSVLNGLCRTFSESGMEIVIEGVENTEQRELAEQIGVDYIQGFLFARPMPADETKKYFGNFFENTIT
jgi:EAL domain-containing protein (putative c-di-GMP-specific phosphodiesterase class I)